MHVSRKRLRLKPEKSFIGLQSHKVVFKKSSIFMMLLLGTGSLIGISSSIYQPVSVETQPQQPQPLVAPNQTVKTPPNLVQPKPQGQIESLLRNYLTGVWKGNDQGTYYVRQVGDNIMWLGMSRDDGKTWANAFAGKMAGDTISGTWVDVPRGKFGGEGTLTLKVSQVGAKVSIQKIGSTGSGFSGTSWEKR